MEKEKGSISPIEGFYWVIASLLCFVCYAYLGWHVTLVNLIIGVVACCSAAAFVSKNEKLSKFCADNSYAQDVFLPLFGFCAIAGMTGNSLWGLLFVILYAAMLAIVENWGRFYFACWPVVIAIASCMFLYITNETYGYRKAKQCYANYLSQQNHLKSEMSDDDLAKLSNPFMFYHNMPSLVKVISKKREAVRDSTVKLKNELEKEKSTETLVIDFPKILRIKRIWLNDDTQPWTYESYTRIYLRMSGGYSGVMSRFGRIGGKIGSSSLTINGNARGVGDSQLNYINVVLSDNSFYQLKVKNSYEWLVAGEGDLVEVYDNKIVPLFKK